jgi:hypothetical protein
MAFGYGTRIVWFAALGTIIGNGLVSLGITLYMGYGWREWGTDVFYFSAMILLFGWITAPPPSGPHFLRFRTAYRIMLGSLVGVLGFLPLIMAMRNNAGFYTLIKTQMERINSLYAPYGEGDVVRRSLFEQITPDVILESLEFIFVRGGGVASLVLFFFLSRQGAALMTWIIRHKRPEGSLARFHVAPGIIWTLSGSLLGVLLGTLIKAVPLEIIAWNSLTLCVILYLAQGLGIVLYFLNRVTVSPVLRFVLNFVFLFSLFNPGMSPFILGMLIILGIAENWAPFRAQKSKGPSSTPRMWN